MEQLQKGVLGSAETKVTEANTAIALGSGSVEVFATPALVALMEKAARESVQSLLPEGMTTVGTLIEVKHLAATPVGMLVSAKTELIEVDGRRLVFKVEGFDSKEKIGEGMHQRFIVDVAKFVAKAQNKSL